MNFLERKITNLFNENSSKSRMELYTILIYSSDALSIITSLINQSETNTKNVVFLNNFNLERLKVEQYARMRNMIFHLKQNPLINEVINSIGSDIEHLTAEFFNSEHFWSPESTDFAEGFIIFLQHSYYSRKSRMVADLLKIMHATFLYQKISDTFPLESISSHINKFDYIISFSLDEITIKTNEILDTDYFQLQQKFSDAVTENSQAEESDGYLTKINIDSFKIKTEL